jgi:hypothetical protein
MKIQHILIWGVNLSYSNCEKLASKNQYYVKKILKRIIASTLPKEGKGIKLTPEQQRIIDK